MKKLIYILIFSICAVSCKTKTKTFVPPPIVEVQPSWDGNKQNSGLIDYIDGKGFVITKGAAERYTALTEKFGITLVPPVKSGEGLEPYGDNFLLSPEHMAVFMEISRLNKK